MSTLVLIPGLAAYARMWADQLHGLEASLPAAVAKAHQPCSTITAMAQAVLDQFDGELVLCGASMGGMVAMEATRLAPSRVSGLALLGTVAHPETPEMHQLRSDAIVLFEQGRSEEIIRANVPLAFHPDNATDPASGDVGQEASHVGGVLRAASNEPRNWIESQLFLLGEWGRPAANSRRSGPRV